MTVMLASAAASPAVRIAASRVSALPHSSSPCSQSATLAASVRTTTLTAGGSSRLGALSPQAAIASAEIAKLVFDIGCSSCARRAAARILLARDRCVNRNHAFSTEGSWYRTRDEAEEAQAAAAPCRRGH